MAPFSAVHYSDLPCAVVCRPCVSEGAGMNVNRAFRKVVIRLDQVEEQSRTFSHRVSLSFAKY